MLGRTLIVALLLLTPGCTYLWYAGQQAEYARLQKADPSQRVLKHMVDRSAFAVIGITNDPDGRYRRDEHTKVVAAFSSRFKDNELVDVMHDIDVGTHFGLHLPPGEFDLLVLSDRDDDGTYERDEVIGAASLSLSVEQTPSMVALRTDVTLGERSTAAWPIEIAVEKRGGSTPSLFYPAGTIRSLDDPIFSEEMATLGLYDPASFFEQAPTLFYALEEDVGYKVPVVFVHGIGGDARSFTPMVQRLDRARFKPWFFHYASGASLDQLGQLFYSIFLSGQHVQRTDVVPMVIVAHSMGGLVVRKALDLLAAEGAKIPRIVWISLASPLGGHPSAAMARNSPLMVLPSWRDLDPEGEFLRELYRRELPEQVTHHLFYAFHNDSLVKTGENSDGSVPLSSQLYPPAQRQSHHQFGFDVDHIGARDDPKVIDAVMAIVERVQTRFPEDHMRAFLAGGVELRDEADYNARELHVLRNYGKYLEALATGAIAPMSEEQERLVPMLRGEAEPTMPEARVWLEFVARERAPE